MLMNAGILTSNAGIWEISRFWTEFRGEFEGDDDEVAFWSTTELLLSTLILHQL